MLTLINFGVFQELPGHQLVQAQVNQKNANSNPKSNRKITKVKKKKLRSRTNKKPRKKRLVKRNKLGRIVATNTKRKPISFRADDVIRVSEVTGVVRALTPLGVRWKMIKVGSIVPNGSFVLMDAGSSMKYDFFIRRASGWFGKQAYINIEVPTNFRINTRNLRKISLGEFYLPMIPTEPPPPTEVNPEMLGIKAILAHIWRRVASFVDNDQEGRGFADQLAKKTEIDSTMGLRARKIKLITPIHGAGIYAFDLPQEVKAIWEPPASSSIEKFKVFVWSKKDLKPKVPTKVVKGNSFSILLDQDGSYFFQVESFSGDYISKPHIAHFFSNKNPSRSSTKPIFENDSELHLFSKHPKFADTFVTKKKNAKVKFEWEESSVLRESDQQVVITRREDGKSIAFEAKGRSKLVLTLPPGEYFWEVTAKLILQEKNKHGELFQTIPEYKSER